MQLVEQEPLWGRFGYSDLKEAALQGGPMYFLSDCDEWSGSQD